jgi:hypothetical protein
MPSQNTWSLTSSDPGNSLALPVRHADGRARSWVVTPGYGALPKDGKPVNPYVDTRYKTDQENQFYSRRTPTGGGTTVYDTSPHYLHKSSAIIGELELETASRHNMSSLRSAQLNAAVVKTLVKVADAKVNVAVALAEASKTSDLILGTAKRIYEAYRAFRKGDLKGVARNLNITPKRLHKSWLEYKYGWMPLLQDVKGSAEYFAQQNLVRPLRFHCTSRVRETKSTSWQYTSARYGGGTVTGNYFLSSDLETRVTVWCELNSPHIATYQQLGLTNPLLIAWELVPFSFVFDWFVGVGDYLTAMTSLQGVTVYRTLKSVTESDAHIYSQPPTTVVAGGWVYETPGQTYSSSERRYDRDTLLGFSLLGAYPPRKNRFDFDKLVTSLALLRGNFRGGNSGLRV